MKKIVSLALVLVLCLSMLASCSDKKAIEKVAEMYENSAPTKVVSTTVQTVGQQVLTSRYSLTTGNIGSLRAAIYEEDYSEMRTVENGGLTDIIYGPISTEPRIYQYIEGKGTRTIHKETGNVIVDWTLEGKAYVIDKGEMAMTLTKKLIENVEYENHVFSFTVPAENTARVFGVANNLPVDASVRITDNGAEIISVHIEYTVPADGTVPDNHVVIDIEYTYNINRITIE